MKTILMDAANLLRSCNEEIEEALEEEDYERYRIILQKRSQLNELIDDLINIKERNVNNPSSRTKGDS